MNAFISTGKAAKLCGVTPDTILKWIKKGRFDVRKTAGGHFRINEDSIKPYLTALRKESQTDQDTGFSGNITYCWEYLAQEGDITASCRTCTVFKSKAERCYLLAGYGKTIGFKGEYCTTSCMECEYFKYVQKIPINILIITKDETFKSRLQHEISDSYAVEFSSGVYETARIVESFHPDFIVIDSALGEFLTRELTHHLTEDERVHGSQIILGTTHDVDDTFFQEHICATIGMPISTQDLEECIQKVHATILGLPTSS